MSKSHFLILAVALLAGTWLAGCGALAVASTPTPLPKATMLLATPTVAAAATGPDGAALLEQRCNACHPSTYIHGLSGTAAQWAGLVSVMVQNGADLNPQEEQVLVKFLAQNNH
jgi:cytochrome c5